MLVKKGMSSRVDVFHAYLKSWTAVMRAAAISYLGIEIHYTLHYTTIISCDATYETYEDHSIPQSNRIKASPTLIRARFPIRRLNHPLHKHLPRCH